MPAADIAILSSQAVNKRIDADGEVQVAKAEVANLRSSQVMWKVNSNSPALSLTAP